MTIKRQVRVRAAFVVEISLTEMQEKGIDVPDFAADPYEVVQRRIGRVMELLECDEAYAERVVLGQA